MKKIMIMLLVATSVFASKARMRALGQSIENGGYFINDDRRVFKNPAYLINHSNLLYIDYGLDNTVKDSSQINHQVEGGIYRGVGNFGYGISLGHEDSDHNEQINTVQTTDGPLFLKQDNRFDLFLSGNAGVKWGLGAYFSRGQDETSNTGFEKTYQAYGLSIGVIQSRYELYIDLDLSREAEGANGRSDTFKANPGGVIGGSYFVRGWKLYAEYGRSEYEYTGTGGSIDNVTTTITLGSGREYDVSETSTLFSDVLVYYNRLKDSGASTTRTIVRRLQVLIGYETDVKDWLAVRGAYKQEIFGDTENTNGKTTSNTNTAKFYAGMSLKLNTFALDLAGELGDNDEFVGDASVRYFF